MNYIKKYSVLFSIMTLMVIFGCTSVFADEKLNSDSKTYSIEVMSEIEPIIIIEDRPGEDSSGEETDKDNSNTKPPSSNESVESPKTGDEGILLWIILAVVSLGLIILQRNNKKENS